MTPDALEWTRRLSAWLADTDIERLELHGPGISLRLQRRGSRVEAAAPVAAPPTATAAAAAVVCAPSVGVLLHRHPQREADLAPVGTPVRSGQPIALLRIGTVLLPVPAPRDGTVTRRIADDGAAVGYGDDLIELSA